MVDNRQLSLAELRGGIGAYIREEYKMLLGFMLVNCLFLFTMFLGLGGVGTLWFLLWCAGYYLFNFVFFRCFFKRQPYLLTVKFFDTLLPAAKVLVMMMVGLTILAYLPYLPLLSAGISEHLKNIVTTFIGDFMGDSNIYNIFISLVLLLCSPFLLFRPLLAWVSSVIGRSGQFKNIFKHTEGYYRLFLGILTAFYLLVVGFQLLDTGLHAQGWLLWIFLSPLTLLFNLTIAKTYETLFLD